jgi:spoIIIJ-associated protein
VEETKYTVEDLAPEIDDFLGAVLDAADLDVEYEIVEGAHTHPDFENPEVVVKFSGEDVAMLLANRAELLLALEHLTMEVLDLPPEDHSRICFDANDYRVLRIEELRMSALTAAEQVKTTHRPFHFNPMTSRERRIIHLALRNQPEVRSESFGAGPARQVVIYPADMPTPPPGTGFTPVPPRGMRRGGPRR